MNHKTYNSQETQEISLRLEQYDDIFSDFDIRPYDRRALSTDFLDEIRRASRDKNGGGIELVLHAPEKERNETNENTIRERLVAHFEKHRGMLQKDKQKVVGIGAVMVAVGIICMILATLIIFKDSDDKLLSSFLIVFLEPAAWFLLWEGMDQIIFNSRNINPELNFYKKMAHQNSHIYFETY
jgi:hypothetical protein